MRRVESWSELIDAISSHAFPMLLVGRTSCDGRGRNLAILVSNVDAAVVDPDRGYGSGEVAIFAGNLKVKAYRCPESDTFELDYVEPAVVTPSVSLLWHWGSEEAIAQLADVLYRGSRYDPSSIGSGTVERRIRMFFERGHHSVFELMGAAFLVECSRACHTQFIRHRMMSFWSESQRYVDYTRHRLRLVLPRGFPAEALESAARAYAELRARGLAPEEARLALPNAAAVRFVAQANLREWVHFLALRTSPSAQAEIRHVAWQIFAQLARLFPRTMRLVWDSLPRLHPDYCAKTPRGEDCRLYAIRDAEDKYDQVPGLREALADIGATI